MGEFNEFPADFILYILRFVLWFLKLSNPNKVVFLYARKVVSGRDIEEVFN